MARPATTTKFLRYEFTPDELQAKGKELAEQHDRAARIEEEFEAVRAQYKERTATVSRDIGRLSREITNGFEMRHIDCKYQWNKPRSGWVRAIRVDTGEEVEYREMTSSERQEELPLNKPADGKSQAAAND